MRDQLELLIANCPALPPMTLANYIDFLVSARAQQEDSSWWTKPKGEPRKLTERDIVDARDSMNRIHVARHCYRPRLKAT